MPYKIYPLNRLRNIAIKRVRTSHFIVLDMDTWPSYSTYDEIMKLPPSYLENDYFATILPVFSFSSHYVDANYMDSLETSIKESVPKIPPNKERLIDDFENGRFTIFRPQSFTHVHFIRN